MSKILRASATGRANCCFGCTQHDLYDLRHDLQFCRGCNTKAVKSQSHYCGRRGWELAAFTRCSNPLKRHHACCCNEDLSVRTSGEGGSTVFGYKLRSLVDDCPDVRWGVDQAHCVCLAVHDLQLGQVRSRERITNSSYGNYLLFRRRHAVGLHHAGRAVTSQSCLVGWRCFRLPDFATAARSSVRADVRS